MLLIRSHVCRYLLISIFVLILVVNCQARRGSRRSRVRYGSGYSGSGSSGSGSSSTFWITVGVVVGLIGVVGFCVCCRYMIIEDRKKEAQQTQVNATQSLQVSNDGQAATKHDGFKQDDEATPFAGIGRPKVSVQQNPLEMPPPSYFDATKPDGITHRGGGGDTYEMHRMDDETEKGTGV